MWKDGDLFKMIERENVLYFLSRDSQTSFGDSGSVQLEDDSMVDEPVLFSLPELLSSSAFDLENFSTLLLNSIENKPLDTTALKGVKNTLMESGSR
ncbi:hypothetical protein E2C01_047492 [Portunus trituberculatus]|uniref:Uncharacterized protein n=1 Tax=Portunus trituberculatus TaxID=210409 RepID=A0A5B7G3Q9_PORTR|nr:hypothetical protein [Portunus trituberculatus]